MTDSEKRILIFYPHNYFEMSSGTHCRFDGLVRYFKDRGFLLDLVSISGFTNRWDEISLQKGKAFFDNISLCEWKPRRKWYQFFRKKMGLLVDLTLPEMRTAFRKFLRYRKYDFVLISYVFFERLVDEIQGESLSVIDILDFTTLNEFLISKKTTFTFGAMFEKEVNAINKFDYALSISEEETLMLEAFCSHTEFVETPMMFPERYQSAGDYNFDIMFIGSDNVFNRDGMDWFMGRVYPLLPKTVRIAVVGKIGNFVETKPNVRLIPCTTDLDAIYRVSRVVMCPLKAGTGLKVKVIEALSYGKPVVTTKWGLTGIISKENNGCILADSETSFADALLELLVNSDHYHSVRQQGIDFFRRKFTLKACWGKLDSIFLQTKS